MSHPFSKGSLIALCGLGFLLAASSFRPQAAQAGIAQVASEGGTAAAEATPPATASGAGFDLTSLTVGLSAVASYKATLVFTFSGTRRGEAGNWSKTYTMLTNQNPAARQVTIDTAATPVTHESLWEINGVIFDQQGNNPCIASLVQYGDSLSNRWEPARFLDKFTGGQLVGSETVNGVASSHYTFDESALRAAPGSLKSTGDVWIATDGGYIVKYVLSSKGTADYFGEGSEGTATWDYELTQVNQPQSIAVPKNCPSGLVDAPTLPDATNVVKAPGVLTYTTATSVSDASAFYQKQIPALGWQVSQPPATDDTTALLSFTQGGQDLSVIVAADAGSTTVQIIVGASPTPATLGKPPTRTPVPTRTKVPTRTPMPTKTKLPTRTPVPTKTPKP